MASIKYPYLFVFSLSSAITSFLVFALFYFFSGSNPLNIAGKIDSSIFRFVPQGWAFFTRNPREAQVILYEVSSEKHLVKYPQKHSSSENLFGINRKSSKLLTEIQVLKANVPDSIFSNIKWNYQINYISKEIDSLKPFKVRNEVYMPVLCGNYLLIFQKTIPWAWCKSNDELEMPAKAVFLKIECNEAFGY